MRLIRFTNLKHLWFRINTVARAILHDLFGEEGAGLGADPALAGRQAEVFTEQQALTDLRGRLDELVPTLAVLTAQRRQTEAELRQTQAGLTGLDAAINAALESGAEELAREKLVKRQPLQNRADELNRRLEESGPLIDQLKADIDSLRARLADAEQQARDVAHHEQSAAALEILLRQRRDLERELDHLQDSLSHRSGQALKAQDRAAARQEIDRRNE